MKAVNLIPAEDRRGGGGAAGRSGGAAYALVGLLLVAVAVVGIASALGRSVDHRSAAVANTEQQAVNAEAQASALQDFATFSGLRTAREETVRSIAGSRFDWAGALREVSRVVPASVSLNALTATVAAGAGTGGGAANGSTGALRGALDVPALEINGCVRGGQDGVADLMAALRQVRGVQRVSLADSADPTDGGADGSGGGSSGGVTTQRCTGTAGQGSGPTFDVVAFFSPTTLPPSGTRAPGAVAGVVPAPSTPDAPTSFDPTQVAQASGAVG